MNLFSDGNLMIFKMVGAEWVHS